jgi:hypothetical protein
MSRTALIILAIFIVIVWVANMVVITIYGRNAELYPMTAWQMFSGRPKTQATIYSFEIVPIEGESPVELPGQLMFYPAKVGGSEARRMLTAIHKSHDYGCPDYRLDNFDKCWENPVHPWVIPQDIAQTWIESVQRHLGLETPPYSISLIQTVYQLNPDLPADEQGERKKIFIFKPASGNFQVGLPEVVASLPANFANQIQLSGYELFEAEVKAGDKVPITFYWKILSAELPGVSSMVQFNHWLDQGMQRRDKYDRHLSKAYLTSLWQQGKVIADKVTVPVDQAMLPGEYYLKVGYNVGGDELPLVINGKITDVTSVIIGPIRITSPTAPEEKNP